jgi:predicted MFS family arabinose efflux permease
VRNGQVRRALARMDRLVGGPARRHVITALACVLALDSADKATVGAAGTQLQHGLQIGKTQLGLLLSVTSLVGALGTIPAGVLVDRVPGPGC